MIILFDVTLFSTHLPSLHFKLTADFTFPCSGSARLPVRYFQTASLFVTSSSLVSNITFVSSPGLNQS